MCRRAEVRCAEQLVSSPTDSFPFLAPVTIFDVKMPPQFSAYETAPVEIIEVPAEGWVYAEGTGVCGDSMLRPTRDLAATTHSSVELAVNEGWLKKVKKERSERLSRYLTWTIFYVLQASEKDFYLVRGNTLVLPCNKQRKNPLLHRYHGRTHIEGTEHLPRDKHLVFLRHNIYKWPLSKPLCAY